MAKKEITITIEEYDAISVLTAAEEIFEIYDNDREYREADPEWMAALASGIKTLNSILYPEAVLL